MEQKEKVANATPSKDFTNLALFSGNSKLIGGNVEEITQEKIQSLLEQLSSAEILNVPDEEEPPSLFNINGVEVLPTNAVGIIAAYKKNGKSNFAGLLMAACASPSHEVLDGAIRSNEGAIKVLNIDTEQPLKDARRPLRRVLKTAGFQYDEQWNDHGIVSISVKDIQEKVRPLIIELAVKKHKPKLLFIDGIADLIVSINDEQDAKALLAWMDYLSCTYDCAVVGMLHLNYNSQKIGGWAGTQANKKFTDSFLIKKCNGFFTVEHEGRGESAPNLKFRISCPLGDKIGWYDSVDANIPELTKEDAEDMELRKLMNAAPLPCTNNQLIVWLMRTKKWTSKSPADKMLKKCKKYGILDTRRDGRQSIWYRVSADAVTAEELSLYDAED